MDYGDEYGVALYLQTYYVFARSGVTKQSQSIREIASPWSARQGQGCARNDSSMCVASQKGIANPHRAICKDVRAKKSREVKRIMVMNLGLLRTYQFIMSLRGTE